MATYMEEMNKNLDHEIKMMGEEYTGTDPV